VSTGVSVGFFNLVSDRKGKIIESKDRQVGLRCGLLSRRAARKENQRLDPTKRLPHFSLPTNRDASIA
jgi:hypothetical protein